MPEYIDIGFKCYQHAYCFHDIDWADVYFDMAQWFYGKPSPSLPHPLIHTGLVAGNYSLMMQMLQRIADPNQPQIQLLLGVRGTHWFSLNNNLTKLQHGYLHFNQTQKAREAWLNCRTSKTRLRRLLELVE